jgi:hypothetical protein
MLGSFSCIKHLHNDDRSHCISITLIPRGLKSFLANATGDGSLSTTHPAAARGLR